MNSVQLKHLYHKHKCKVAIFFIIILFIKALSSWTILLLEKVEKKIEMPTSIIETNELFSESRNYILEKWKEWKALVTNSIDKDWIKKLYKTKIIKEAIEQKELKWTLNFDNYKLSINNNIWDYILNLNKKNYKWIQNLYTKFSKAWEISSKTNFNKLLKMKWNFKVVETIPLYDNYSSKAITKTKVIWELYDSVLDKTLKEFEIYSYFENNEFKILNPEYISLETNSEGIEQFVEGTNSNKSHFLELKINKAILKFPNKIYFSILAKSTENVLFNKIKIELINIKTWEVIYKNKINYKDISFKSSWKKWIVNWKIWYKTNFWAPIEFDEDSYASIMDKMLWKNWKLDLSKFQLNLTPENDLDIFLNYKTFKFKLIK